MTSKHVLTLALAVLLAACGAGSVKDPFIPDRIVVLGDALSDMTTPTTRYTVNDAASTAINNWAEQIASSYGLTGSKIVSKAVGNAKIADVGVQAGTITFLPGDLVLVSAGYRDLIDDAEAGVTSAAAARAKGTAYAEMVRGIAAAGAKHIIALNMYSLGQTPYQALSPRTTATHPLGAMTDAFNAAFLSNLGDSTKPYIGDAIRQGKAATYMASLVGSPAGNGFVDATTMACTSIGNIGIIGSTLSSAACTTGTLNPVIVSPLTYDSYVFADPVYLTPAAHRGLGTYIRSSVSW